MTNVLKLEYMYISSTKDKFLNKIIVFFLHQPQNPYPLMKVPMYESQVIGD